jgi:probable rRNA maturation factor
METMLQATMERVLKDCAPDNAEVDFHLLDPDRMAHLNEHYLQHDGPTDVITFTYLDNEMPAVDDEAPIVGEIFVCPEVARSAASDHDTSVEEEIVLYLVHGVLHLSGLDDVDEPDRKVMRQAEATEMAILCEQFDLSSPFDTP